MNKTIYNLIILFFIGSFGLMGQSKKKYQKTFPVDKNTKLKFETQNVDVTFKVWNRDEVKIDFIIDFRNYSDKEIQHISNGIDMSALMESTGDSNYLQIRTASPISIGKFSYYIKNGVIHLSNTTGWVEADESKSFRDLNKEVKAINKGYKPEGYIVFENDSVALKDVKTSHHKGIQSVRSTYEIYVPAYMILNLQVSKADLNLDGKFANLIRGSFHESNLKASELHNNYNAISLMNGSIKIKNIKGGSYTFKDVNNGEIGEIEDAFLETEFSVIDIRKITKNVQFSDFKSDIFIYNLGDNFKSVHMICKYSDIKIYIDKDQKYYMEAIGNNAVLNDNGTKIIMQPNKNGDKHKMFTRGKDNPETRKNTFKLDLIHGFVTLFYNK